MQKTSKTFAIIYFSLVKSNNLGNVIKNTIKKVNYERISKANKTKHGSG